MADRPSGGGEQPTGGSRPAKAVLNRTPTMEAKLLASILSFHLLPDDEALVAQDTLDRLGSIGAVFRSPPMELFADEAVGNAVISNIDFIRKIIFNETSAPLKTQPVLENLDRLIGYLRVRAGRLKHEHVRVMLLDAKNRLIDDQVVANGNTTGVSVDVRSVLCLAVRTFATSIIIVHNHPSGDPNPSVRDVEMTNEIKQACDFTGIKLTDHVIVAGERWYSFRYSGDL